MTFRGSPMWDGFLTSTKDPRRRNIQRQLVGNNIINRKGAK